MAKEARSQRRASGDISTRAQQRYGSVLPPSLRRRLRHIPETQDTDEVDNGSLDGAESPAPAPAPAPRPDPNLEDSVHFDDIKTIVRQGLVRSKQKKRAGRRTRIEGSDIIITTGSIESDESGESGKSIASKASIASDSMPVYLPPELTGSRSRALEADAKGPSMPVDGSLRLDLQVSIERYCIYPSTCFQVHRQKESALPAHPEAFLTRSPAVDGPKHVSTFEWIHMQQSVLDVFQFKRLALEHLKVWPMARTLIAQNIDDFKLDTGQPDSGPTFAKPHCERLWGGEGNEEQSILMLTLPLVYLHDHKGRRHIVPVGTSDKSTTNHRTLLQMLFPRMGSNVHGQQAHYQSGGHSGYLHVTQFWCIMLNGGNEDDDPVVTARDTLDAAQVRTTTSDSVEDFLVFPSEVDTKLYEACKRMTAAQAFLGPYCRMQSVTMPAASADPADLTSNNVSPDIKRTNLSDPHGSEEEAMKNGLYQSLMEIIWPLTHLFTPSYRSEGGPRTSLKFWGAILHVDMARDASADFCIS
ncbi:hypothetical protein LTR17_008693 [Elasticomyces elasticus]|nr:hypothetical protein LTR17_008693 [Elasticomyces elasticus]